jgi:hypothetical protein
MRGSYISVSIVFAGVVIAIAYAATNRFSVSSVKYGFGDRYYTVLHDKLFNTVCLLDPGFTRWEPQVILQYPSCK